VLKYPLFIAISFILSVTFAQKTPTPVTQCKISTPAKKMILVAHRGDEQGFIENSTEALQSGLHSNADYVETDIRKTKDGVFMIHHDGETGRVTTCGSKEVKIEEATWEFLRKNCRYKGTAAGLDKINSLAEFLDMAKNAKAGLVLDVKPVIKSGDMKALADQILTADPKRIVIYVNDIDAQNVLWKMAKGLDPHADAKYKALGSMTFLKILGKASEALKNPARYLDNDGIAFNFSDTDCETLQALRKQYPNQLLYGWTLGTPAELRAAQNTGLDGIVTSRLGDYLKFLKR
jgi:glycerophosphoryl diester phosphodiesterase